MGLPLGGRAPSQVPDLPRGNRAPNQVSDLPWGNWAPSQVPNVSINLIRGARAFSRKTTLTMLCTIVLLMSLRVQATEKPWIAKEWEASGKWYYVDALGTTQGPCG